MRSVPIPDAEMAFHDSGARPPLLLVHGFPFDHMVWEPQIAAFHTQRRVLAPDLIGFGASSANGRSSLDGHADDLVALLDARGIRQAVVVGSSMGGYIALALWRRHRSRVAGLVLLGSRAAGDPDAGRAARYQLAIVAEEQGVGAVADAMLPRLLSPAAPDEIAERLIAIMRRQPTEGVVAALKAMAARPDSTPDLDGIDVPALLVAGADDVIIPPSRSALMAERIPGARLAIIPNAGHMVNLEQPEAVNEALLSFLTSVDEAEAQA